MVQIEKKKCRSVKSAMKYQYWCILTFSTVEKLNTLFQDAEKNILELWICIDILFLAAGMQAWFFKNVKNWREVLSVACTIYTKA